MMPSVRQLVHPLASCAGRIENEESHNGACNRLTEAIAARDRQHEAELGVSRAEAAGHLRAYRSLLEQGEAEHEAYKAMKAKTLALAGEADARLDGALGLLRDPPTVQMVAEPGEDGGESSARFEMCIHCGSIPEDCDSDGKCWGARVRAFLASPESAAPPKEPK